jgi:hypothetical protein
MKWMQTSLWRGGTVRRRLLFVGLLALAAALLIAGAAGAQVSTHYDLSWYVLDGSNGQSAGSDYVMGSAIGQPAVGSGSSDHFGLESGQPAAVGVMYRYVYLPLTLREFR